MPRSGRPARMKPASSLPPGVGKDHQRAGQVGSAGAAARVECHGRSRTAARTPVSRARSLPRRTPVRGRVLPPAARRRRVRGPGAAPERSPAGRAHAGVCRAGSAGALVGILRSDHGAEECSGTQRKSQRYTSHEVSCERRRGRTRRATGSARLSEFGAAFGSVFIGLCHGQCRWLRWSVRSRLVRALDWPARWNTRRRTSLAASPKGEARIRTSTSATARSAALRRSAEPAARSRSSPGCPAGRTAPPRSPCAS